MRIALFVLALSAAAPAQTMAAKSGTAPSLAVDAEGTFHLVFVREGSLFWVSSTDQGKTWGNQKVVGSGKGGKAPGAKQRGPRLGLDDRGDLYVVAPLPLDEAQRKERYPRTELCLMRASKGGDFGQPLQVNEVVGAAAEALHWSAVAPDGTVHIAWLDNRDGDGNCIWYAKFAEGKVSKNAKISKPACPCCAPGLALDGRGNPLVVWREMSDDGSREIYMASSTNGGKSFSPPSRVNKKDSNIPD